MSLWQGLFIIRGYFTGWAPLTAFTSLPPLLHTPRDSETAAQLWLSLIINYIPRVWTLLCSAFKIGKYLALFISFKLGSALLPVWLIYLSGLESPNSSLPQVNHFTQTCDAKMPQRPKGDLMEVETHQEDTGLCWPWGFFPREGKLSQNLTVLAPLHSCRGTSIGRDKSPGLTPWLCLPFYLLNVEIDFIQLIRAGSSFCFLFVGKHEVTVLS